MSKSNSSSPRLLFFVTLLVVIFTVAPKLDSLSAQDATATATPSETATVTATWTETPTLLPTESETATLIQTTTETATEILIETATLTETATPTTEIVEIGSPIATLVETPTETATSEIAPSPSSTATASATLPAFGPEPALTELFTDNFDTGELYLWTLGNGWTLTESEGGFALQSANSDEPVTFVHSTLSDVAVQAHFQFETGMVRLSVRQSDSGAYTVVLDSNGQVLLQRGSENLGAAIINPNTPGIWRTLRLSAIGDIIRVVIDGNEVIAAQDITPLPQGTISFAGIGNTEVFADDVGISISSAELALLTSTTTTPSPTSTLEPQLPILFTDDFSNGSVSWSQQPGMKIVPSEGEYALSILLPMAVSPSALPRSLSDVILEARVQPLPGTATRIVLRQSGGNGYLASIDATGLVELYRNDVLLQSATYNVSSGGQWHSIRFFAIGNILSVHVDGTELISVVDPNPLSAGVVSFSNFGVAMEPSLIDDVSIWGQVKEDVLSSGLATTNEQMEQFGGPHISVANPIDTNTKLVFWQPTANPGKNILTLNDQQVVSTVKQDSGNVGSDLHPVYSPDGTKIVYNVPQDNTIRIIDASNGSSASNLIAYGYSPSWSPDGQWIVYQWRDVNFNSQLFVVKSDGSAPAQPLTVAGVSEFGYPDWFYNRSTRTHTLAFSGFMAGPVGGGKWIIKVNITLNQGTWQTVGAAQVVSDAWISAQTDLSIIDPTDYTDWAPKWSPDGSKIVFARFNYFTPEPCNFCQSSYMYRIFVINSDGTDATLARLTDGRSPTVNDPTRQADGTYHNKPSWSPNGSRIVYEVSSIVGPGSIAEPILIKAMNSNGSNKNFLTVNPGQTNLQGHDPDWYGPCAATTSATNPGLTQEASDMFTVASASGLYVLDGPTINAKIIDTIPWSTPVLAIASMEFPQPDPQSQIWYQVKPGSWGSGGWVAARMENKQYFSGFNGNIDPCVWLPPPNQPLVFNYNRAAAANYAIQHGYKNDMTPIPNADDRVTKRITGIPFANFVYADLDQSIGGTGSAVFISESFWMGGLPMTLGESNSCVLTSGSNDAGWRTCWRPSAQPPDAESSPTWDVHKNLINYYVERYFRLNKDGNLEDTVKPTNNAASYPSFTFEQGSQITFPGLSSRIGSSDAPSITTEDLRAFFPDSVSLGGKSLSGALTLSADQLFAFAQIYLSDVRAGDYAYIDSFDPTMPSGRRGDYHGLFIVGWQAILPCDEVITNSPLPSTSFYASLSQVPTNVKAIPYVADSTSAQSPRPRPFYCTAYLQPGRDGFLDHSWWFFKMPDQISIPYSQLYVDPNWKWLSTDGS